MWSQVLFSRTVSRTSSTSLTHSLHFGHLHMQVHTYEAEQIPTLQVEQQQLYAIKTVIFEKRAQLREAFAAEDHSMSKVTLLLLPVVGSQSDSAQIPARLMLFGCSQTCVAAVALTRSVRAHPDARHRDTHGW